MGFFSKHRVGKDLAAGAATALVAIPDGLASAVLAGLNPVYGLYALMIGTPVAALAMSSQLMYVANTGALTVATGSALRGYSGEALIQALMVVTFLVGVIQLALGLLRLGGIVRFVSASAPPPHSDQKQIFGVSGNEPPMWSKRAARFCAVPLNRRAIELLSSA